MPDNANNPSQYPMPGKSEFSADEETAMRQGNGDIIRSTLTQRDAEGRETTTTKDIGTHSIPKSKF